MCREMVGCGEEEELEGGGRERHDQPRIGSSAKQKRGSAVRERRSAVRDKVSRCRTCETASSKSVLARGPDVRRTTMLPHAKWGRRKSFRQAKALLSMSRWSHVLSKTEASFKATFPASPGGSYGIPTSSRQLEAQANESGPEWHRWEMNCTRDTVATSSPKFPCRNKNRTRK